MSADSLFQLLLHVPSAPLLFLFKPFLNDLPQGDLGLLSQRKLGQDAYLKKACKKRSLCREQDLLCRYLAYVGTIA